jgi:hypothetical protein
MDPQAIAKLINQPIMAAVDAMAGHIWHLLYGLK